MNIEQLLTLRSIIQEGSFKRASLKLHKSQPALSMAIKNLEDEYQIKLFNRDHYRPILTPEGRIFFEKSLPLLNAFVELDDWAKSLSQGEEPIIRLAIDAVSPVPLILKILDQFFSKHPHTRLELNFEVLGGTLERLMDEEVDLALTHVTSPNSDLEWEPITSIEMIPVIHRELIKNKKVTKSLLLEHNQIVVKDTSRHTNSISFGILEGAKQLVITDNQLKKELILAKVGWGSLPKEWIKEELKKKILIPIKLGDLKSKTLSINLIRKKSKALGQIGNKLWEEIRKTGH